MKSLLVVVLLAVTAFVIGHPRSFESRNIVFANGKHIDTTTHPSIEYEASEHSLFKKRFGESKNQQYLVHFAKPISHEERLNIERKLGQPLGSYMPHHTYFLYASPSVAEKAASLSEVHWVGRFSSEYKFSNNFNEQLKDRMVVMLPSSNEAEKIAEEYRNGLRAAGLSFNEINVISEDRIEINLPNSRQNAVRVSSWIAEQPSSHYIEPIATYSTLTHDASKIVESGNDGFVPRPFQSNNIVGNGQIIGLADTGIRNDHCMFNDGSGVNINANPNLNAYKIICYNTTYGDQQDADGHGTLVAGIVAGYTTTSPAMNFTGIGYGAKLYFSDIGTGTNFNPPSDLTRLFNPARAAGAATYLLPWGADASWYNLDSVAIDNYMRTNDDFLIIVPAGNNGPLGKLTTFAYSKNALVVGSSISTFEGALQDLPAQDFGPIFLNPSLYQPWVLSTSSSRGPTADGRIKPDVVAPGQRIKSASISGTCSVNSANGTSLAAAVATGTAAIVREYLSRFYPTGLGDNDPYTPVSSSLVKAILINAGVSLSLADSNGKGNWVNLNELFPSGHQGFGRITLSSTLLLANYTSLTTSATLRSSSVTTGQSDRLCFNSFSNLPFIKVTLVWNDAAASPLAGHILVNDLDLVVLDSNGRTYKTNTADGGFDATNNVEQVFISNPPNAKYAVYVFGRAIPTGTQQSYSLVMSGPDIGSIEDCNTFPQVCPNSCNMIGTCRFDGTCQCPSGREGVDCSIIPCPVNSGVTCSGNGVCDYATSTCICGPQYTSRDCSAVKPPETNDTQSLPVQIQYVSADGKISTGLLAGVAVGAFILGTIIALVLGAFIAVKYLEYKRDRAQQDRDEEMD